MKVADYKLDDNVYQKLKQLFIEAQNGSLNMKNFSKDIQEHDKPEFLLCVDHNGTPVTIPQEIIDDFEETIELYPEYSLWFNKAQLTSTQSTLLIARWLCHLFGFRHQVVHLFIDHPKLAEHTLLQVRSIDKPESPSRFDLPVAGHVISTEKIKDTLQKEIKEELEIEISLLRNLVQIGSYNFHDPSNFNNTEYRVVFYARLSIEGWLKASANSDELAAIASLPISKLHQMMVDSPNSIASGLQKSFEFYIRYISDNFTLNKNTL